MAAETIAPDADELLKIAVEKLLSMARALTSGDGATSIDHQQGFGVEPQRVLSEEPLPDAIEASVDEGARSSHSPQQESEMPSFAGYDDIIPGMFVTNAIQGLLFGIEYFGIDKVDKISRGVFNVAEALAERSGKKEDIVMYLDQVLDYLENAPELAGTRLHCYVLYKFAIVFERQGRMANVKRALYSAQRIAAGRSDMADFEMAVWASLISMHKELGEEQLLHSARLTFLEICEPRLRSTSGSWPYEILDHASVLEGVGRTCFDIGLYSNDMERMDDGINYLTEALRERASQPSASVLLHLAECYGQHPGLSTGQHASLILLEQAIAGFQQLECTCSPDCADPQSGNWGGTGVVECGRHHRLADALKSLGIVQQNQGFMEEAQRSFERGLELVEECHDADREAEFHLVLNLNLFLKSHMNIAFGLQRLDDIPDLNSPRYKYGFDHFREFLNKTRPGVSFHRDQMAIYAKAFFNPPEDLNQGLVEKVRALQEMLQMAEKRGSRSGHAFHHQNLSVQYLRIGDIAACKEHLFLALKSLQETPTTTEEALWILQPLGWVAMEPKIQEFDRAYEIWRRVYSATEEMLENMARISEEHAFRYFEISKHACMALAKCQMSRAKISQETAEQLAQSALVWAERGKGRMLMSFIDASTQNNADPASQFDKRRFLTEDAFALNFICNWLPASPALVSQQRKTVFVEYTFLDYKHLLTQIVVSGPGSVSTLHCSSVICLHCELSEETRQEAETYLNSVQNSSEATQSSGKTVTPTFQQEIQNVLSAMNKYSTNRIPFNPWIPGMVVGIQKHIGEAIAKLRRNRNSLLDKELDKIAELLQALYAVLIAPIKEHLAAVYEHGRDTLVFVPHEDLGIVPFAALQYVSGGSPRYLIEDYAISVSPSIWCTRHCQYLYEKIVHSEYEEAAVPVLVGKKSGYPPEYPDLNEAHKEVDAVAEAIGQSTAVMVLKDDELSHALMMEVLPNASWIHLTVHGEVSSEFPQGSLLFSEDASQRLAAEEIMTIAPSAWRARAVVLSACQTGLGSVAGGGIMGFARSFILAGVPSSVLSMWQAEERFCTEFMQKLYQQLASGSSLAYAMQEVIKSMMHEYKKGRRRYREFKWSILHWACFSCLGFPSVVLPNAEERTDQPLVESN